MSSRRSKLATLKNAPPVGAVDVAKRPNVTISAKRADTVLNKHNAYLQTILHPVDVMGVKVPDGCYEDSCTYAQFQRLNFDGGTAGYRSVMVGVTRTDGSSTINTLASLIPGTHTSGGNPIKTKLWYLGKSSATYSDVFDGGATADSAWYDHASADAAVSTYRMGRLVSAAVRVTCAAAPLSAKGWVTMAALPRGLGKSGWFTTEAGNITLSMVLALPGSVTVPLNNLGEGLSAIYRPIDNACFEYTTLETDFASLSNPDETYYARHDIGGFLVVAHGTDTTTVPPLMLECVTNYECIAKANSMIITSTPSFSDPLALSHALNEAEKVEGIEHGANGFEGLDEPGHPIAERETHMVAAQCDNTKGAAASLKCMSLGSVVPTVFSASKRARQSSRAIARQVDEGAPEDLLTTIMNVVVPLASKFLPMIAAAL